MNFFKRKTKRPIKPEFREVSRLTVEEWRSVPELVSVASKLLHGPSRDMIDVLRNSHLALQVMNLDASVEARAFQQARSEGYSMALNDLESLGRLEKAEKIGEPTFEPEEI